MQTREDTWIRSPKSPEDLVTYLGKHMVAYPFGRAEDKSGGQFIGMDTGTQTASLRRYDTGQVTEFPLFTTDFRYTRFVETPFTGLTVGEMRRFDWFYDDAGRPTDTPITLIGTVDFMEPDRIVLWVRDLSYGAGGWWATIRAADAPRHSLRRLCVLNEDAE
ncbi:hypothetical protein [Streptomyces sp. CA-106110]|uniref:hypothetical protein n=1 Tax=Streptomyces sp. CA-106110 TaxID=3240044 RepID=UPI003D8C8FDB